MAEACSTKSTLMYLGAGAVILYLGYILLNNRTTTLSMQQPVQQLPEPKKSSPVHKMDDKYENKQRQLYFGMS